MSEPNKYDPWGYPGANDPENSIFRGFEQVQTEENPFGDGIISDSELLGTPDNRKPLYFLLFASLILMIAIMVVVYVKIISVGGSVARETPDAGVTMTTPAGTPTSSPTSNSSKDATSSSLEAARQEVKDLVNPQACDNVDAASSSISNLAKLSQASEDVDLISTSLSNVSKLCGADFTVSLQTALKSEGQDLPGAVYTLAAGNTWFDVVRPAPEGAKDTAEFAMPSNNIRCQISDSSVSCSIYTYSYPSPPGCEGITATYEVGLAGAATAGCTTEINAATTLDYGTAVSHNGFACTLDQTAGVECWSELSGNGFSLRRAAGTLISGR